MNWDLEVSIWIREHFPTETLRRVLGRWNRGEVFFLILLPLLYWAPEFTPFFPALAYVALVAFVNDRLVLVVKKWVSRGRPLIQVAGKVDANPDMKHSFPSAHSANSIAVIVMLVFGFSLSPWLFLFTVVAGIGRLLSLHHFLSDILGGWILGFAMGYLGVLSWNHYVSSLVRSL